MQKSQSKKEKTYKLKAANIQEREAWVETLRQELSYSISKESDDKIDGIVN